MNITTQMNRLSVCVLLFTALVLSSSVSANDVAMPLPEPATDPFGQVTLPLDEYQRLLQLATTQPLPSPSSYAVGQSILNILFQQREQHISATITAELQVETFAENWTLVPLLGPGAALESATVDGQAVQLVQRAEGLFWLAEKRRKATVQLTYHVDARFAERAWITSLPIPRAAATRFNLRIPQTHIDLAVAPAANLVTQQHDGYTSASGTLPTAADLMVSWRVAIAREYVLSRAEYQGQLAAGSTLLTGTAAAAIAWQASIDAELMIDGEVSVPLVSTATALISVAVDGKPATVFADDFDGEQRFAVRLAGAGKHRISLQFLSPASAPEGVPTTAFDIPDVPVSRFELRLPGDQLVQARRDSTDTAANLPASVDSRNEDGTTLAVFHLPMSRRLALNWMEAIPADVAVERRANAVVYQALHAAEGVLYGLAAIRYEITRGEARVLEFQIPASAQVNHISSAAAAIADWIVVENTEFTDPATRHIRVFLNRAVSGEFTLDITYEQLLEDRSSELASTPAMIEAPILRALDVTRQKGMVALLAGPDLALAPLQHPDMSEVGENQLPAFFRNSLQLSVAHTFKYHSEAARLAVKAVTPERQQGKFNAQIDTLISIGDVTLKGQVSIENDVKSGVLRELRLILPDDVNILGVTGPSIRTHTISMDPAFPGRQLVDIEFTREMDGQFRIELNYERIMLDGTAETQVPRIEVADADVAHGRIAIEALSALEVKASKVEHLSSLEISELPRQLVLKTTNPILLAYRYVHTETPFDLQLRITRHEEIDVQVAAIDTANYQTLITTDGLAVTRVAFEVRNSRRQFLRLALPPDSEIWSVFVNGNAQKPAFAADSPANSKDILIKMINSATAFPVELVYATRGPAMHPFGTLEGSLPRPDMIVTHSNWDVYVPADPSYGRPQTNMEVLAAGIVASVQDASIEMLRGAVSNVISGEPLHIELPTQGLLFRFAKLYANQSSEEARFSLRYVHQAASFAGLWLSLLATLAAWVGIALLSRSGSGRSENAVLNGFGIDPARLPSYLPWSLLAGGSMLLTLSIAWLGASVTPPSLLSLAIALFLGGWKVWRVVTIR